MSYRSRWFRRVLGRQGQRLDGKSYEREGVVRHGFTRNIGAVALVACSMLASCGSDHHVSAWVEPSALLALTHPADVSESVARLSARMKAQGLEEGWRRQGEFVSGEPFCLIVFEGAGVINVRRSAARLVTPYGVVLAFGPGEVSAPSRTVLRWVGEARQWRSGDDVNADRRMDMFVRTPSQCLQVWSADAHGSSPYPLDDGVCPDLARDLDEDGSPELVFDVYPATVAETFGPWTDVLVFSDGRYTGNCESARRIHRRLARQALGRREKLGPAWSKEMARVYLQLTLMAAWHRLRSGEKTQVVFRSTSSALRARPPFDADQRAAVEVTLRWLRDRFERVEQRVQRERTFPAAK